ncbi:hypothetical protein IQ276_032860 [Desmonostoc muscorum LEGE 12446]|uniref:PEP-CTERM sorting domain-containing protein n=1 Tax=Desmonostoc muscorum LEGE 12446 TaxID=1828758 RepID=A0A8J6ZUY4_DESMC|nr:hypothetical protein [Desmonostoc muscorum]MCF2151134.1 hypothetical protein [Desmonostoc muscorum LEGE 12446]
MVNIKNLSITLAGLSLMTIGTALASAPAALAAVIDFDSLSDFEIVDDQFLSLGADFNGTASILQLGSTLNPDFPPVSGNNIIYDNPSLGSGTIRIDAVDSFWSSVGGFVTGNTNVTLTAYNASNSILGTASTGGANFDGAGTGLLPNIFLSITYPDISYVTFEDSGNTYTIDNFTFTKSVPEPSVMLGTLLTFAAFSANSLRKGKRQQVTTKS